MAVFPPVGDELRAEPASGLALAVEGPFAAALAREEDNLVLQAARALAAAAGIEASARLSLVKNLPVASGIGGGSADAAATLRLLSRVWDVQLPIPVLQAIALALGADVPVCLASKPTRMGGVGEALSPAPALPVGGIALVNPGLEVSTASVFRARSGAFSAPAILPRGWHHAEAMAADIGAFGNDLEAPAITLCPPIAEVLAALRAQWGCRLARMSGSGPTCFGLFPNASTAATAAAALRRPGWWSWGGALR